MQAILQQINTLPEVIGSIVCNNNGQLLAHAFPPLFDEAILNKAATTLAEGPLGRQQNPEASMLDFRYSDGRIIARKLDGGMLMVLCTKSINPQVLTISLNVARNRIETLLADQSVIPGTNIQDSTSELLLVAGHLDSATASQGFNQLGMVGLNHNTAKRIMDRYETGPFKKLTLTNQENALEGTFPVMIINDEEDKYNDKIILSPSFEKKLQATAGTQIKVTL